MIKNRPMDHASLVVPERALQHDRELAPYFAGMGRDDRTMAPELNDSIELAPHGLPRATVSSLSNIDFEGVAIDGALSEDLMNLELVQSCGRFTSKKPNLQIELGQMAPNVQLLGASAVQIDQSFPATD